MSSVEEKYFLILKDYFSDLFEWIEKKGSNSTNPMSEIFKIYSPDLMKNTLDSLTYDLSKLNWDAQLVKIKKIGGLKTVYLGDAFTYQKKPTQTFDFLKKTALYADTSIIRDSILSEALAYQNRGTGEGLSFPFIAYHALSILKIEGLFASDIEPQICTLAPSSFLTLQKQGIREKTDKLINEKIFPFYVSEIFGKVFESDEELTDYLEQFKSFEEFKSVLKKSKVVFESPTGEKMDTEVAFNGVKEYYEEKYWRQFSFSEALFLFLRSRYSWIPYEIINTKNLTSNFVTDFKGVWNNYTRYLKKDNELINKFIEKPPVTKDTLVIQALQQQEFSWLGDIPLYKIHELRERGELGEMREILGENINEIKNAKDIDFVETASQINYSLSEKFKKHEHEVKNLDKTYRRKYKINVPTLIASGTLGIISAVFPNIASFTGIASLLSGSYSVPNLIKDYLEKKGKVESLKEKPIAMLFDAKKIGTK